MSKSKPGNFFEDFTIGQTIRHATPRTVWRGDMQLYTALFGSRFAVQSSKSFASSAGYPQAPIDDMLVFHIVFGKTVPDISMNAIANLGYADGKFLKAVYVGDTLSAISEVIGLKENSSGQSGTVYVRSTGYNQKDEPVLSFARWVMVRKRNESPPTLSPAVPDLPLYVDPQLLGRASPPIDCNAWDDALSGSEHRFDDYAIGEKIDHIDGMTVEDSEHQLATRLYQNTASVHFNHFDAFNGGTRRRLVYGGYVISMARALSYNGLQNAFHVAGINGGQHLAPTFAGSTIFAWSEITDKVDIQSRSDVGALRLVTRATRDLPCPEFPTKRASEGSPGVVLEFDYWVLLPR